MSGAIHWDGSVCAWNLSDRPISLPITNTRDGNGWSRSLLQRSLRRRPPNPSRPSHYLWFLLFSHELILGHVAKLIHRPRNSRQVGQALKFLQDESVPWQRVVNHKGIISPRDMPGAVDRQRIRLLEEGVVVEDVGMDAEFNGGGGGRVELALFGWFPDSVEVQQLWYHVYGERKHRMRDLLGYGIGTRNVRWINDFAFQNEFEIPATKVCYNGYIWVGSVIWQNWMTHETQIINYRGWAFPVISTQIFGGDQVG